MREQNDIEVGIFPMVGDLLHAGHLSALEFAKHFCDKLIIALNINPNIDDKSKSVPVESALERTIRLRSTKYVDEVIPYCGEEELLKLLQLITHTVRFIGEDHKDKDWTGKSYEASRNITTYIVPREHSCSSTELKVRVAKAVIPKEFLDGQFGGKL